MICEERGKVGSLLASGRLDNDHLLNFFLLRSASRFVDHVYDDSFLQRDTKAF